MKLDVIAEWIEKIAPLKIQESYDNSGLIIGDTRREIKRILVCLDADENTMEQAVRNKADLILSHHPCIFRPMKTFSPQSSDGGILFSAIKNDIAIYSAHTNFDSAKGGMGDILCREIGLKSVRVLKPNFIYGELGLGRVGLFEEPIPARDFLKLIFEKLNLDAVREVGSRPENISKVAIFNGSFDRSIIEELKNECPDVLITGDLKYHDALELKYQRIYTLDVGHYKTEIVFVKAMASMLKEAFPDIEVHAYEGRDVFKAIFNS